MRSHSESNGFSYAIFILLEQFSLVASLFPFFIQDSIHLDVFILLTSGPTAFININDEI